MLVLNELKENMNGQAKDKLSRKEKKILIKLVILSAALLLIEIKNLFLQQAKF